MFDAQGDAGRLTVRFLWLGPQVAEDKPWDAMIPTSPDGKVMVLDAGHPQAAEYVTAALDALGVTRIDYLVASHPHIDHIGGFPTLLSRYEVGAIYTSALTYEASAYYQAFLAAMTDKGLSPILLQEGDSFSFGEEVTVEVFNPPAEITYPDRYPEGATQFINNQSLVYKFTYGDSTILLAGDLYAGAEREVAERWAKPWTATSRRPTITAANTSSPGVAQRGQPADQRHHQRHHRGSEHSKKAGQGRPADVSHAVGWPHPGQHPPGQHLCGAHRKKGPNHHTL